MYFNTSELVEESRDSASKKRLTHRKEKPEQTDRPAPVLIMQLDHTNSSSME